MIKKKSNAYKHITANIAKLVIIQQATGISPSLLVTLFLKNISNENLFLKKKTKDEYWDWSVSDGSGYKYFKRASIAYLKKNEKDQVYQTLLEFFKNEYLTRDYFGMTYAEAVQNYKDQEAPLRQFVREAFIKIHPITPEMNPVEKAIRNQKLGKISVNHWIGDITNYDYFSDAPGFMMENVKKAIQYIEIYILNILNEKQLDHDLMKLSTNQKLQFNLPLKKSPKQKVNKI
ncbi:hypothetical protein [Delftia acidovorans]|uniref:hypothetical protein n=1 Tax=Delftia acidovorans TaxID=80866 RepID=UPI00242D882B|nr:hypothetical protein [Delftia acidovorans]